MADHLNPNSFILLAIDARLQPGVSKMTQGMHYQEDVAYLMQLVRDQAAQINDLKQEKPAESDTVRLAALETALASCGYTRPPSA